MELFVVAVDVVMLIVINSLVFVMVVVVSGVIRIQ